MAVFIVFFSLHLNVELCDSGHQGSDVLVRLSELLLVLGVLCFEVIKLAHAVDFDPLVLLAKLLHAMRKLHAITFNLGRFVFVMSLDFGKLLVRCLNGLLCMFSGNLRVVLSLGSVLEIRLRLSELGLSSLGILSQRFNKVVTLCLGNFVVSDERLRLLVLCLEQADFML